MGWRMLSALVAFWIAAVAFPLAAVTVVGTAVAVLVALILREQLAALAARWRDDETRPAPTSRDE